MGLNGRRLVWISSKLPPEGLHGQRVVAFKELRLPTT